MKVALRSKLRKVWKQEFDRHDIRWCEIRLSGCWMKVGGFAHAKKSDELKPEEYNKVVAACNECHRRLDEGTGASPHQDMEDVVDLIIMTSSWPTRTEDLNRITGWKL